MATIDPTTINPLVPPEGAALTADVRANFLAIQNQFYAAIADLEAVTTIAAGGTGQITQQAAIDALTAVSAATDEYILTKDTASGNAVWKIPAISGTVAINQGGTGQVTAQAAIDSLSQVSGGTNEYVLTKDTASGNALWKNNATYNITDNSNANWLTVNSSEIASFASSVNVPQSFNISSSGLSLRGESFGGYITNVTGVLDIHNNVNAGTFTLSGNNTAGTQKEYIKCAGGIPAVSIKYDGVTQITTALGGPQLNATPAANDNSLKIATTAYVDSSTSLEKINSITGTVAASALTCGLAADSLYFRDVALGTGTAAAVEFSTLSLVIPSGATLGTVNAIQSRLILLAINNAGTVELAVVNLAGGNDLSETGLISTTAISAAADSDNVVYSTTARTSLAYRVVGYIESTQATAGTWATTPSTLQGAGGNALTSMSSLGYGQTWQTLTGSRAMGTTYYNTTGKPITAHAIFQNSVNGQAQQINLTIDGAIRSIGAAGVGGQQASCEGVIPPGSSYSASNNGTYLTWHELR